MSDLQQKLAEALLDHIDPMCASTGEAQSLAGVALAVVREHLLSDEAVDTGADVIWDLDGLSRADLDEARRIWRQSLSAALGEGER